MYKKTKIFFYFLFVITLSIQVLNTIFYIDCVQLINEQSLSSLAVITLLPLFIIGSGLVFLLSIINSIIHKRISKKIKESNINQSTNLKTFVILSWLFAIANLLLILSLYIF